MAMGKKIPRWVKPAESPLPLPANPNPPRFLSELFVSELFLSDCFRTKARSSQQASFEEFCLGGLDLCGSRRLHLLCQSVLLQDEILILFCLVVFFEGI